MAQALADCVLAAEVCTHPVPSARLRVLAVVPGNSPGSGFVFVKRQLDSLRRMGVEVEEVRLPSRTSWRLLFQAWQELDEKVRALRPDMMHAHYGTATAFLCSLRAGVPLVITFRGSDLNPHPSVGRLRRALGMCLSQCAALRARRVICVSGQLRDRLWWGKNKTAVVPTGINLARFCPRPRSEARAALGWDAEEKVVLFCAGTEPVAKGLSLVEESVVQAERRVGPIRLQVLDGSVDPDTVPCFLNAADCLAFASRHEGSPNIVKEALACNLPVVSVDVGDVRERLAGVFPSKIVSRDAGEFGAALAEILRERSRSNGRERVRALSETIVAETILQIYAGALGKPAGNGAGA